MNKRIPAWLSAAVAVAALVIVAVIVFRAPAPGSGTSTAGQHNTATGAHSSAVRDAHPNGNPTPGYPTPTPYKSSSVVSDTEKPDGSRVVAFTDGGTVTFRPMNGSAATGVTAFITKSMLGQGSPARGSIRPPGYTSPWPEGPHARGHVLARLLGGSGDDARNLFTIIQKPVNSPQMSGFEDKVRDAVERGENVHYSVTLQYEKVGDMPRYISVTAKGARGAFSDSIRLTNKA